MGSSDFVVRERAWYCAGDGRTVCHFAVVSDPEQLESKTLFRHIESMFLLRRYLEIDS
jgi:hypothetical protein